MNIVEQKELEFKRIIDEFRSYLFDTYGLRVSDEDLNDRVLAFIERYGIKTSADKSILRKIKDDFLFADFLVNCEETGKTDVLDYFDKYTIALSLSEIFTYCEEPQAYTAKGTCVYFDTNLLFRLLGIGSLDRSDSYVSFLNNMRELGICIKVYDHTVNEMIGIIEGSKAWIGNPDFDASLASEASYYFVRNGWSVEKVNELSCNLRTILQNDFHFTIDTMPYPKTEDIKTPFEAEIKEMIISEYKESNPSTSVEEIDYSINQDAKSIFFTQHKNNTVVPYHINDVKNIFITSNRSLAKVGYQLSYKLAGNKEYFIPTVMTDIKWGTLLWFNSPAKLSAINRPRLVSAAYAAFRPSEELTQKLNTALRKLEERGDISPEQCYLLKVNPIAQRLLAKKTINDPDKFIEETPLEILKELRQKAFDEGSASRQQEIVNLAKEKKRIEHDLAVEKQRGMIAKCEQLLGSISTQIDTLSSKREDVAEKLNELESVKKEIDRIVKKRMVGIKICLTIFVLLLAFASIYVAIKWSWVIGIVSFIFTLAIGVISLWNNARIDLLSFVPKIENHFRNKLYKLRRYSEEAVAAYNTELNDLSDKLEKAYKEKGEAETILRNEYEKLNKYSADISNL